VKTIGIPSKSETGTSEIQHQRKNNANKTANIELRKELRNEGRAETNKQTELQSYVSCRVDI
jgi:hypothetical protein